MSNIVEWIFSSAKLKKMYAMYQDISLIMASLKNMLKIKIKSNTYTPCMADCEGGVEVTHPRRPSTLSCHHSTQHRGSLPTGAQTGERFSG